MTIVAAHRWRDNAQMIAEAVVPLGYIRPTDSVIDLTFGRGKWWTDYVHPGPFTANVDDLDDGGWDQAYADKAKAGTAWGISLDFRDLYNVECGFDVVVFDPPYVSVGGRATTGIPDFHERYGLTNAESTPEKLQADNNKGLAEAARIVKPGGLILAKCAPYISSGVRKEGDWWSRDAALELGLKVEDMFIHLGDVRAQPKVATCRKCGGTGTVLEDVKHTLMAPCDRCKGKPPTERKQKHARNNFSVLFILKKPKPRKRKKAA